MKKLIVAIVLTVMASGSVTGLARAADPTAGITPQEQKRLFRKGAKLWPVYCNTCHNARPGSEKASYEWDEIMMHMRTLGNVPPDDARAILEYLKTR